MCWVWGRCRVDDEYAGQLARCPQCQRVYTVPPADVRKADERDSDSPPVGPPEATSFETAESDGWWLRTPEGQTYGPVDRSKLNRWLEQGRVAADCDLRHGSLGTWRPASQLFSELSAMEPRAKPFAEGRGAAARPAAAQEPHRGALILGLGLAGLLVTCPLLSVMAWMLGNRDVRKMRDGTMDPTGMGMTEAGRVVGMLLCMLWIAVFTVAIFVLFVVIVAHA